LSLLNTDITKKKKLSLTPVKPVKVILEPVIEVEELEIEESDGDRYFLIESTMIVKLHKDSSIELGLGMEAALNSTNKARFEEIRHKIQTKIKGKI